MVIKLIINISCLAIIILTGCAPSPQVIKTSFTQTQETNPTSSFTPIPPTGIFTQTLTQPPTGTPTGTLPKTKSPSPTPEFLSLQLNLKYFLLEQVDFPHGANYSSIYDSAVHIPNQEVDRIFVKETERIDGWSIWYGKDYGIGGWLVVLSDEISLYKTPEGAQLAVNKYSLSGFFEDIYPPQIGDSARAFHTMPGTGSQSDYVIIFSYRNLVHVVDEYGNEKEVAGVAKYYARILLAKLQASPMITP
jgi:hypothetical protein